MNKVMERFLERGVEFLVGAAPVIAMVGQAVAAGAGGPWVIRTESWRGDGMCVSGDSGVGR